MSSDSSEEYLILSLDDIAIKYVCLCGSPMAPRVNGGHLAGVALCAVAVEPQRVVVEWLCRSYFALWGLGFLQLQRYLPLPRLTGRLNELVWIQYWVHNGDSGNDGSDHDAFRDKGSSESDMAKVT